MPVDATFEGETLMQSTLAALAGKLKAAAGNALRAEAEIEMTEAKRRTPVWNPARKVPPGHVPGSLRASGRVTGPEHTGNEVVVKLLFGGGAVDYAVYVHENMEDFHATGQAKFLESTLLETAPHLAARVAARMARETP